MDTFYKKGLTYFGSIILVISIMRSLKLFLPLTEKEVMYSTFSIPINYFEYSYEPWEVLMAIGFLTFTIWFFFFALDIRIGYTPRK